MSIFLVLWILLNSETSKTFADSSSLDGKEQAHQNSGFVGVYFETEAEKSTLLSNLSLSFQKS